MFRLHAFGGLFLERDGARVDGTASQRKRLAVLTVIASEPNAGATREKLAALLWPESDEPRARNALYQAVAAMRRDLGSDALLASPAGDLRFNPELITSDVGDFQAALASGDLERAIAQYTGPLLDGIHIRDAPEFEEWADELRRRCARRYQDALSELAKRAESSRDHELAARWLRRLAETDPLSAPVTLRLMAALSASGDRDAALRQGRIYMELVRANANLEPDARVAAMMSNLTTNDAIRIASVSEEPVSAQLERLARQAADVDREHSSSPSNESNNGVTSPVVRGGDRKPARLISAISAGVVVVLAAAVLIAPRAPSAPALAGLDAKRVVVADFENRTGDTTFNLLGATLADWVTQGLTETGVARVVDPASRSAVRQLDPRVNAAAGKARAIAMARAANAGTVVSGTIYRQGEDLVMRAQIVDVVNDHILWSLDPIASPPNDPLRHADALRDRIAGAVAAAFDTEVRSLTLPSSPTPTFPAYQEYVLGLEAFQLEHATSALAHFRRSAELDTTFSLPLIWGVYASWRAGLPDDSSIAVLARHRPPPGTLEELQLQEFQSKDENESFLLLERGAKRSPGSVWSFRAGDWLLGKRRVREGLRYWDDLDPEHGWIRMWFNYWKPYAEGLHEVGRYEDELRAARTYMSLFPASETELARYDPGPFIRAHEGMALIALGRTREARERLMPQMTQWDRLLCMSSSDFWQASMLEFLAHGQPGESAEFGRRWIETCERSAAIDTASGAASYAGRNGSMLWLGVAYYRSGRYEDAERALTWAMSRPDADSGSRAYAAGFLGRIAAKRGDRVAAENALRAMPNKSWAELPVYQTGNISELYAVIEGLLGEPGKAVERLKTAKDEVFYLHFHRDPDFAPLWKDPAFAKFATPR